MNKKILATSFATLFIFTPFAVHALSSEIHVTKDGKATVSSAKIVQIAGNTMYGRLYWGDAFVRMTIKTNSQTKFFRGTGEPTTIKEVQEGDLLDVSGELQSQSDTLTLIAGTIKNSSVQKEQTTLSGTITAVSPSMQQFTLNNKERGFVTVVTATSTQFIKGSRTLDIQHIRIGDRVIKTSGDYDIPTRTLVAQTVTTYIDPALFKPRNFIGKLTQTPLPTDTTIKVTVNDVPFTIFIGNSTTIMRNDRSITTLQRFVAGDTIKLYGTRRETDDPIIDAEIIRNINL